MWYIYVTYLAAGLVVFGLLYLARLLAQGAKYQKGNRMDGKVIIVTGANGGIGMATALNLAQRGARIYLACRNKEKGEQTMQEIIEQTGNPNVVCRCLDLASFASIRKFVDDFKKEESELHVLINNAAAIAVPRATTTDGLEMQIGTNHFGHFLLTNLLLDHLRASSPSRIINVSSMVHKFGRIKCDDINSEKSYGKWKAYAQSKLANVLFTRELAKRLAGSGVVANSLHPGAVMDTARMPIGPLNYLFKPCLPFMFKTTEAGAQTSVALAVDPVYEIITGKYFADCKIAKESRAAQSDETAEWLWQKSEEITGLKV